MILSLKLHVFNQPDTESFQIFCLALPSFAHTKFCQQTMLTAVKSSIILYKIKNNSVASYLDLLLTRDKSNNVTIKLYDKPDAFGFRNVYFLFMSSNIPSAPAYGVYASQLIHYARCCSNYSDFITPQGPSYKTSVTGQS